jgi:transcriptional regulator with AAA-type ATPase domain
MNIADHLRLGQREQISVIQQVFRRISESLPANVSFRHAVSTDRRPHRSIDDGDTILEDLLKRMLVDCLHVSLMALSVRAAQIVDVALSCGSGRQAAPGHSQEKSPAKSENSDRPLSSALAG